MKGNKPLIIAFDTSCDDTSCAILEGRKVLSSEVSSQVEVHAPYGGVVPDIARREHERNIPIVFNEALKKAKVSMDDIDYVACTYGPGLAIDLEIGLNFAKELAIKYGKPFIPVNHMEGHLLSGLIQNTKGNPNVDIDENNIFPALGLLVSGKHTDLVYVEGVGKYTKIGETLDDAVGEAFDKVARMLNLGYPGGPVICDFARRGESGVFPFTVPMKNSRDLNFSYSGIKTAALYKIKELKEPMKEWIYDFARGFLDAIIESLKIKLELAISKYPNVKSLFVGGGVFNSQEILTKIGNVAREYGLQYLYSDKEYRGDNAGMIGIVAYYKIQNGEYIKNTSKIEEIDRVPRLSI